VKRLEFNKLVVWRKAHRLFFGEVGLLTDAVAKGRKSAKLIIYKEALQYSSWLAKEELHPYRAPL
jgi:hypothetical protein